MLHLSMVLLSTTGKDLTTSNGQVKVVYMRVSYGNFFILPLCYAELGQGANNKGIPISYINSQKWSEAHPSL